jgi:hypothetical protein
VAVAKEVLQEKIVMIPLPQGRDIPQEIAAGVEIEMAVENVDRRRN